MRYRCGAIGTVTIALSVAVAASGCGRSSSTPHGGSSGPTSTSAAKTPNGSESVATAGEFGTLKKVCTPGPGTGGSGRGIAGKTIHLGVMGDPGSTVVPGLEQQFFDVADAFANWCNAAGGINGRTIVVDKLDAKLFNGAKEVITACSQDFMLVGGGNALDAPDVKPRLACKLGQIPAYTVSPQATNAGLQITPVKSFPTVYPAAALRLLALDYPQTQQGLGIAGSSLASLVPQGLRAQEAWRKLGYTVSAVQPRPAQVDNYRPWMEQMKAAGAKADYEIGAQDPSAIFAAMSDTGFSPQWVLFGSQFYGPTSVNAAKAANYLPASYVPIQSLPFDLADKFPVVQQVKDIMAAGPGTAGLDGFTSLAFNAWTLWAQSASACGNNLTQDCVLDKAGSHTDWNAGGLFPAVSTSPRATQPNKYPYNCDPRNLVTTKSYQTGS
jgi:hypothetical protein